MAEFTRAILPGILGVGQRDVVASPFQFALTGSENLRITVFNSLPGVTIALQGRVIDSEGNIKPYRETIVPTSDRMATTKNLPMGKGIIINMVAFAVAGEPRVGQTFVQVKLIQGFEGATIVLGTIIQGYVTSSQERAWPGSPIETSLDGGGYVRTIVGTTPAAGAEISETVPTGARWELISIRLRLTTSAVAGDRSPLMGFSNGGQITFRIASAGTCPPSDIRNFFWAQGVPNPIRIDAASLMAGLVTNAALLAGDIILTATSFINAADQYNAPVYTVREWIEAA